MHVCVPETGTRRSCGSLDVASTDAEACYVKKAQLSDPDLTKVSDKNDLNALCLLLIRD